MPAHKNLILNYFLMSLQQTNGGVDSCPCEIMQKKLHPNTRKSHFRTLEEARNQFCVKKKKLSVKYPPLHCFKLTK